MRARIESKISEIYLVMKDYEILQTSKKYMLLKFNLIYIIVLDHANERGGHLIFFIYYYMVMNLRYIFIDICILFFSC